MVTELWKKVKLSLSISVYYSFGICLYYSFSISVYYSFSMAVMLPVALVIYVSAKIQGECSMLLLQKTHHVICCWTPTEVTHTFALTFMGLGSFQRSGLR